MVKIRADATDWYKDAVMYELHVRAFRDSDGDGIGDFRGLAEKLDYIHDLGVTALWLLPFFPSPLKDDGYDIADYCDVLPNYGTLQDFRLFLREAHERGIHVITELVLNHTSDQHAWFKRARASEAGSRFRDFYVWNKDANRYRDARIIFKDFEQSNWTWDPETQAYFWHRFYHHQPDLNFDNPAVKKAIARVVDFWFDLGVDGLRLDAVPYLYEREGTPCENLPETHAFLKELRRHVDTKYRGRMLLAEANQWPEDAVAYFGDGDECHMCFHFPIMPRLFMALSMEDRFPVIDILEQTPAPPATAQWALFLRNHDELTLEMVSDEERDYMWRMYAHDAQARINLGIRRRLAPLLGNNRRRMELMNSLLLTLPGTPVIYYGDELGMGDNVYLGDRNGVRTPMQWSPARNAGFSNANPQRLYLPVTIDPEYHYETINVESQRANPSSFLWWMIRMIALRKRHPAFGRGTLEFLKPANRKVLCFVRSFNDERILVVANLSRYVQHVELDLASYASQVPVEMIGGTVFPAVGKHPYFLTLGPHAFLLFELTSPSTEVVEVAARPVRRLVVGARWDRILEQPECRPLEQILAEWMQSRVGSSRRIRTVRIADVLRPPDEDARFRLVLATVQYADGDPETELLTIGYTEGPWADKLRKSVPLAVIASVDRNGADGVLFDAVEDRDFCEILFRSIVQRRRWRSGRGHALCVPLPLFRELAGTEPLATTVRRAGQANVTVSFRDRLQVKLFHRVESEQNPELEIARFLSARAPELCVPRLAGAIEYRAGKLAPATLALAHEFVAHQDNAWSFTLDRIHDFLERVMARGEPPALADRIVPAFYPTNAAPPPDVSEAIGPYLESARLLGRRTAEIHVALASDPAHPGFSPERFNALYQRSLYQSLRNGAGRAMGILRERMPRLSEFTRAEAEHVLAHERKLEEAYREIMRTSFTSLRIRCHGDLRLGQALFTGRDFVIVDFEGDPTRSVGDRRIKRTPLKDVANMMGSFRAAAHTAIAEAASKGAVPQDRTATAAAWLDLWVGWVSETYLAAYVAAAGAGGFLPDSRAEFELLLRVHLLDAALEELDDVLQNRAEWAGVPLRGFLGLMAELSNKEG